MMAATIRDVAKKAEVSVATVSRVLNNSANVTEQTYNKVMAAIEELDFYPSAIARRLSTGRTHTIAVLMPFLTLPSSIERLRGVQSALAETEFDLVLFSAESPEKIDFYLHNLARRDRADGVIIISLYLDDAHLERFRKVSIPLTLIDSSHPNVCSVTVDDVAGGYMATHHLIEFGHKRIAYLSDYLDNPYKFVAMKHRFKGYQKALSEADIPLTPNYHRQSVLGGRNAVSKAKELLALPRRPTAIFAASDTHAVGVLKAAQEMHIRVPEELSVIGYDGIRDSEHLQITTVHQPLLDSGKIGVASLLKILESKESICDQIKLPIKLIERGTTSPP
jgi:DNA-binding LacI/PurR family transcriptional regulator